MLRLVGKLRDLRVAACEPFLFSARKQANGFEDFVQNLTKIQLSFSKAAVNRLKDI